MFRVVGTKERLVDRIVIEIQDRITSGSIQPGTILPPERELCEQLGVSRTALREAVRMLITKGLLETRPGVGTTVRQVTGDQIIEPLSFLVSQSKEITLDDLHQVRQILEVEIARLAALKAEQDDIHRISQIVGAMDVVQDDPIRFAELDSDFHRALAETTHNALLVILLDSLREIMMDVRLRVKAYQQLAKNVLPDHQAIVDRVAARDPEAAAEAMISHLEHARRIQKEFLDSIQEG